MHPADRVKLEWETTFAAVAGGLAQAARQGGGVVMGTAAELHKLGSGDAWPRSALELEKVILPELARRPGRAGCTVQPIGSAARGQWHIQAAPLKPVVPPIVTAAAPVRLAPVAMPAPVARPSREPVSHVAKHGFFGGGGLAVPSVAEFERVAAAAKAAGQRRMDERAAAIARERRAIEHNRNLKLLGDSGARKAS